MRLSRRRLLLASAIAAVVLMPWVLESAGLPLALGLGGAIGASTALILVLLRSVALDQASRARRMDDASQVRYRQLEALTSLVDHLKPRLALPPMRGWAASPDLLRLLCQLIAHRRPERILELGSGVSTLVMAYCLKRLGAGKLLSLEHEPEIAARTNRWLASHRLENLAEVKHAPLVPVRIAGEDWPWYDLSRLELPPHIDFLFVDGPPGNLRALSRYPAMEQLKGWLDDNATIVLDDAGRPDETRIAERWCLENAGLGAEYHDLEKGAVLFRWPDD